MRINENTYPAYHCLENGIIDLLRIDSLFDTMIDTLEKYQTFISSLKYTYAQVNNRYYITEPFREAIITAAPKLKEKVFDVKPCCGILFTATGFTTVQTGTAYYTKIGNQVTLRIPDLAAVSNTTLCTITGLPVELRAGAAYTSYARVYNASTTYNGHLYGGHANTIEVYFDPAESAFTASGVKGITNIVNFSYTLA
jgi:hypothetical protein